MTTVSEGEMAGSTVEPSGDTVIDEIGAESLTRNEEKDPEPDST